MSSYRLSKPLLGVPVGQTSVVTIPPGAEIERDDFLQQAGLTVVVWAGHRVTVSILDLHAQSELAGEGG